MNDSLPTCPKEIYPKLGNVNFYRVIPSIESRYNVDKIVSYAPLGAESGGKQATMGRVVLQVTEKSIKNAPSQQLRLIIKAVAASPAVLMSCREVNVYEDIIQPLVDDFTEAKPTITNLNSQFPIVASPHLLNETNYQNTFPSDVLRLSVLEQTEITSPKTKGAQANAANQITKFDTFEAYHEYIKKLPTFHAPMYYYGEINEKTNGKLLIIGEAFENSGHSGSFFGNVPHNDGYDTKPMLTLYPNIAQLDITRIAFSSIAKLHAKYWNYRGRGTNVPEWLPSYCWYFNPDFVKMPTKEKFLLNRPFKHTISSNNNSKDAETPYTQFTKEYKDFVAFGVDSWTQNIQKRIDSGLKVSKFFEGIVAAMIKKSTPEAFWEANHPLNPDRPPISVIHCDYFPHNSLISSSDCSDGVCQGANVQKDVKLTPNFFIIDYEFTCVSCPAQDLAQWAISQVKPNLLAKHEDELLALYYSKLEYYYYLYQAEHKVLTNTSSHQTTAVTTPPIHGHNNNASNSANNSSTDSNKNSNSSGHSDQQSTLPIITIDLTNNRIYRITNEFTAQPTFRSIYPLSALKQDYINGFTKWVWLILCSAQLEASLPLHWLQFFIDQTETFMLRHGVTTDNVPLFRR